MSERGNPEPGAPDHGAPDHGGLDERFADWVDDRLEEQAKRALEAELAGNEELRREAEEYRATVEALRQHLGELDEGEPPAELLAGVMQEVRRERSPFRRFVPVLASLTAAAALVLLVFVLNRPTPRPIDMDEAVRMERPETTQPAQPEVNGVTVGRDDRFLDKAAQREVRSDPAPVLDGKHAAKDVARVVAKPKVGPKRKLGEVGKELDELEVEEVEVIGQFEADKLEAYKTKAGKAGDEKRARRTNARQGPGKGRAKKDGPDAPGAQKPAPGLAAAEDRSKAKNDDIGQRSLGKVLDQARAAGEELKRVQSQTQGKAPGGVGGGRANQPHVRQRGRKLDPADTREQFAENKRDDVRSQMDDLRRMTRILTLAAERSEQTTKGLPTPSRPAAPTKPESGAQPLPDAAPRRQQLVPPVGGLARAPDQGFKATGLPAQVPVVVVQLADARLDAVKAVEDQQRNARKKAREQTDKDPPNKQERERDLLLYLRSRQLALGNIVLPTPTAIRVPIERQFAKVAGKPTANLKNGVDFVPQAGDRLYAVSGDRVQVEMLFRELRRYLGLGLKRKLGVAVQQTSPPVLKDLGGAGYFRQQGQENRDGRARARGGQGGGRGKATAEPTPPVQFFLVLRSAPVTGRTGTATKR